MKKDLPIYDIKLSDDTQGVGFISLVDEPAIGVDWIKLAKQEPVELFMSLTDNGLCFGCPPNGDGTRVNGEPDGRCKGDGSGKTGGSKGGSKSTPKSVDRASVSEAKVGDVITYKPGSEGAIDFPDGIKVTSVRDLTEGKEPGTTKDGKQYETKVTTLTRGGEVTTQYRMRPGHLNEEDVKYIKNTNLANPITHVVRKNSDGTKSVTKGPGWDRVYGKDAKYWLVQPSGQIKQNYGKPVTNTDPYGLKFSKSIMAKKALGTLDGSGCFGCPPNGDGTRVNGEPDGRCKGDGSGKTGGSKGGGKSPAKSTSKVSTITPEGHIDDTRASDIIGSSTKYDEKGNSVPVKISKDEMDSIEKSISGIKVEHKPYWGDKDQTKGRGPKYHLGSKDANGNQAIKSVYIQGGKLRTGHEIGWINKDNGTFRLNEYRNSRGFRTSSDAYDLFTNKNSNRALN